MRTRRPGLLAAALSLLLAGGLAGEAAGVPLQLYWVDQVTSGGPTSGKVQRADLDGSNLTDLVTGRRGPVGIALDVGAGKIYWTESANGVLRSDLDGSNVESVVSFIGGNAIDLDPAGGKIYWADFQNGKVQRANLDGSSVQDLFTGLSNPEAIAVDPLGGKVYYADRTHIRRADLDGSNPETLLSVNVGREGLALDLAAGKLYFSVENGARIQRADLDGTNVEDVVSGLSAAPRAIALDTVNGTLYWSTWPGLFQIGAGRIFSAGLDGSGAAQIVGGLGRASGLAVSLPEPSAALLLATSLLALALRTRRRRP